jgi:hypothetical protein
MRRILFSLVLVGINATVAVACECPFGTHKENFKWARAIFIGEAISVGKSKLYNPKISDAPLYAITFRVEKSFKGAKRKEFTVLTDSCSSMCCQVQFSEGRKYLVYVYEDSFVWSNCAWSTNLETEKAVRQIRELSSLWFRVKARWWLL